MDLPALIPRIRESCNCLSVCVSVLGESILVPFLSPQLMMQPLIKLASSYQNPPQRMRVDLRGMTANAVG